MYMKLDIHRVLPHSTGHRVERFTKSVFQMHLSKFLPVCSFSSVTWQYFNIGKLDWKNNSCQLLGSYRVLSSKLMLHMY